MTTYADIQQLHESGQTAAQIAVALNDDPRTKGDIAVADLSAYLQDSGLLQLYTFDGLPGGALASVYAAGKTTPEEKALLNKLLFLVASKDSTKVRTTADEYAVMFKMLLSLLSNADTLPLPYEQIAEDLQALAAGRKFEGVTEAEVQSLIDEREKVVIVDACREAMAEILKPLLAKDSAINAWLDALDVSGLTVEDVQIYCDALLASEDGNPQ